MRSGILPPLVLAQQREALPGRHFDREAPRSHSGKRPGEVRAAEVAGGEPRAMTCEEVLVQGVKGRDLGRGGAGREGHASTREGG